MKAYMTMRDVSLLMNVSQVTVRVWKNRGKLPEPFFDQPASRVTLWKTADILKWAAERDHELQAD